GLGLKTDCNSPFATASPNQMELDGGASFLNCRGGLAEADTALVGQAIYPGLDYIGAGEAGATLRVEQTQEEQLVYFIVEIVFPDRHAKASAPGLARLPVQPAAGGGKVALVGGTDLGSVADADCSRASSGALD